MSVLLERRRMMMQGKASPWIQPASDGLIWAYYNIVAGATEIEILHDSSNVDYMLIDDDPSQVIAYTYDFVTPGIHLVRYKMKNNTPNSRFFYQTYTTMCACWIPSTIESLPAKLYLVYGGLSDKYVVLLSQTPPTIGANTFYSVSKIYVPYTSDHSVLSNYQSTYNMNNIYELNPDGTIPSNS